MRLRRSKKLPPPPIGPEPLVETNIERFIMTNGSHVNLQAPHISYFLGNKVAMGEKISDKGEKTWLDTIVQMNQVEEMYGLYWSPWRNRLVKNDQL